MRPRSLLDQVPHRDIHFLTHKLTSWYYCFRWSYNQAESKVPDMPGLLHNALLLLCDDSRIIVAMTCLGIIDRSRWPCLRAPKMDANWWLRPLVRDRADQISDSEPGTESFLEKCFGLNNSKVLADLSSSWNRALLGRHEWHLNKKMGWLTPTRASGGATRSLVSYRFRCSPTTNALASGSRTGRATWCCEYR